MFLCVSEALFLGRGKVEGVGKSVVSVRSTWVVF